MFENIPRQHSVALDEIIRARLSMRAFSPISPKQENIEAIKQVGLLSPFGAFNRCENSELRSKNLSVLF